ncbi:MAG: hypothetical protein CMQ30_01845 [Gammaproteobacteria bacterium]|mgnify:FL=1|nr:hypothetical protein [Gammaproteobacteria bacterium]
MNFLEMLSKTSLCMALLLMISLKLASAQTSTFQEVLVDVGYAKFLTHVWSAESTEAETIFALPGSGADVSRYQYIGPILAEAGYKLVAINQRGILGSSGNLERITLRDLAGDVIAVADKMKIEKFHMAGWAFGNRTSRMVATAYPERLASLILIAAGGLVPALTEPGELAKLLDDHTLNEEEKIYFARRTMFSPETAQNVVRNYVRGLTYWPEARKGQTEANRNTPLQDWAAGGEGPVLMIMGVDDLTAPIENGYRMKAQHGDRLTLISVENAGHAVGLEKPKEVAEAMIEFLQKHAI